MLPLFSYKNWFTGSPFLSQARKKNVGIHMAAVMNKTVTS